MRAAGLQPGHVPAALRRRQDAGRVQQRHRDQPLDERRRDVHRRHDQRARAAGDARRRQPRPTSSGSGPRSTPAGASRCPTTTARYGNDETTGFSDVSLSGSRNGTDFATDARDDGSMPPPTQFEGDVLRRLQRAQRRRRGPPVLDGHARSGPVRLPRLGRQRDAAAERLHGRRRPRGGRQRPEHLHPGARDPAA